jgi:cell division septum initiation protein DivIVA
MDEVFTIIGKMYLDIVQSQKAIAELQKQIEHKDKEIASLQQSIISQSQE